LTILPVWPICWLYGIQPESTAHGRPDGAAERRGEVVDEPEAVRPADAAAAGDDDPRVVDGRRGARRLDALDDRDLRRPSCPVAAPGLDRPGARAGSRRRDVGPDRDDPASADRALSVMSFPPNTLCVAIGPASARDRRRDWPGRPARSAPDRRRQGRGPRRRHRAGRRRLVLRESGRSRAATIVPAGVVGGRRLDQGQDDAARRWPAPRRGASDPAR
jgi:hypothetical protein